MAAAEFQLELQAQCVVRGLAVPIQCGGLKAVLNGGNLTVLYAKPPKKTTTEMDLDAFMKLAKRKGHWQEEVKYNGSGEMKGEPIIHYLASRGLEIGRGVIGNNVDILPPGLNCGMQFFPAKIVSFDDVTGSHEIRYFGKGEHELEKIHLPLATIRWLPKMWEPYSDQSASRASTPTADSSSPSSRSRSGAAACAACCFREANAVKNGALLSHATRARAMHRRELTIPATNSSA